MFEIAVKTKAETMWQYYRSMTLGRPVVKQQAYEAIYPWIELDGIYFHRSLETVLTLLVNGVEIPSVFKEQYEQVKYIYESAKNNEVLNPCKYGFVPKDVQSNRLALLKKYNSIGVAGIDSIQCKGWNTLIYTDLYNLGGDVLLSTNDVLRLSQKIPVVCSDKVIIDYCNDNQTVHQINWSNIWIWD